MLGLVVESIGGRVHPRLHIVDWLGVHALVVAVHQVVVHIMHPDY